jgi:hypothetical protein
VGLRPAAVVGLEGPLAHDRLHTTEDDTRPRGARDGCQTRCARPDDGIAPTGVERATTRRPTAARAAAGLSTVCAGLRRVKPPTVRPSLRRSAPAHAPRPARLAGPVVVPGPRHGESTDDFRGVPGPRLSAAPSGL